MLLYRVYLYNIKDFRAVLIASASLETEAHYFMLERAIITRIIQSQFLKSVTIATKLYFQDLSESVRYEEFA